MRISWARALAGTALAICMATPVAAWAGPQSASGEKDAAGQDTPGASGEDSAYPPIIVTAQKRSQTLIDVPQSVSVVSGDLLERQNATTRSEEHKSELQSLMRNPYAVFGLKKNTQ